MFTIYCHTHAASGRRYVGLTKKTMEQRWREHVWHANADQQRGCAHFWRAIRAYGPESFAHHVLETCATPQEANQAEAAWIEAFSTRDPRFGFNLIAGGRIAPPSRSRKKHKAHKPHKPHNVSSEGRARLSAAAKAIPFEVRSAAVKRGNTPEVRRRKSEQWTERSIVGLMKQANAKRSRTHCNRGHEYTPANTYVPPDGSRACRECKRVSREKGLRSASHV